MLLQMFLNFSGMELLLLMILLLLLELLLMMILLPTLENKKKNFVKVISSLVFNYRNYLMKRSKKFVKSIRFTIYLIMLLLMILLLLKLLLLELLLLELSRRACRLGRAKTSAN